MSELLYPKWDDTFLITYPSKTLIYALLLKTVVRYRTRKYGLVWYFCVDDLNIYGLHNDIGDIILYIRMDDVFYIVPSFQSNEK